MRVIIDIPKEFEQHFKEDAFEDSLHRLSADAHLLAGNADIYIAKIESDLEDCRNELCLYCGDYKMRHKGACDGCRWYK